MRDFLNCKHEYILQTKLGIPSLLPFVCKHCGMGSWFSTVEEEEAHIKEADARFKKALEGNTDPELQSIKKHLGIR